MKKLAYFIFFATISFLVSCGGEGNPKPSSKEILIDRPWEGYLLSVSANTTNPTFEILIENALSITLPYETSEDLSNLTVTFKEDGTLTFKLGNNPEQNGTWALLENNTKIKLVGPFEAIYAELLAQLPDEVTPPPFPESFIIEELTDTGLKIKATITWDVNYNVPPQIVIPMKAEVKAELKRI
jgi:hypothetical protein